MPSIKQIRIDKQADKALRELAKGNMDGLSEIYDLYGRLILSVAYSIVGNLADAEDILQDVMIMLCRYAPSYQANTSPRAYVTSITRHRAIDLIRKRKNDLSTDEIGEVLTHDDGELAAVEVLDLLSGLSEEEQQIVLFHLYAGLSHRQIAEMLELTTSATEKKYRRALEKLKKQYES